mgnify:FL=1
MASLTAFAPPGSVCTDTLSLSFEARQKSRFLARLESGEAVGIFLPRGAILRDGDCLTGPEGRVVRVRCQPESVSVVMIADPDLRATTCYHLGNRHVTLQILPGELRYLTDHVLDDLIRQRGLQVAHAQLPFEPEPGAYQGLPHGH